MQPLDPLERRIVVALQADGRASWTEIAAVAGYSVTTVARRGQQLIARGLVRIAAVPSVSRWGPADMLTVRLRCQPTTHVGVARQLAARPDVRFLALVTGSHDMVAELVVPKGTDLAEILVDELQRIPGVIASEADLELHTYKMAHDWSRQILDGDTGAGTASGAGTAGDGPAGGLAPAHECAVDHFDDLDRTIIDRLGADGRLPFQTLAAELGVNESTVRRRFESLRERGCILIVTLVPAPILGYEAELFLWLDVAPTHLDGTARELARHRGVRYVAALLGQDSLMCEVIMPTTQDLFAFTTHTLAQLPGIRAWRASIQLLTVKRGFVLCPWAEPRLVS